MNLYNNNQFLFLAHIIIISFMISCAMIIFSIKDRYTMIKFQSYEQISILIYSLIIFMFCLIKFYHFSVFILKGEI